MRLFVVLLAVLSAATATWGKDTTHCSVGQLASVGDTKFQIKRKCGEPFEIEYVATKTIIEKRHYYRGKSRTVETQVEIVKWYYCGPSNKVDVFTFTGSQCTHIETLRDDCY